MSENLTIDKSATEKEYRQTSSCTSESNTTGAKTINNQQLTTEAWETSSYLRDQPSMALNTTPVFTTEASFSLDVAQRCCFTSCFAISELSSFHSNCSLAQSTTSEKSSRHRTTSTLEEGFVAGSQTPSTMLDKSSSPTSMSLSDSREEIDYIYDAEQLVEVLTDLSEQEKIALGFSAEELILDAYLSGYTVPTR